MYLTVAQLVFRFSEYLKNDLMKVIGMENMSVTTVLGWGASLGIIFGGVIPYIPQYLDIRRTANAEGFSTFVCLTLLIANILRIMFWFGKNFELPLLVQSYVMIITMLLMIHVCIHMQRKSEILGTKARRFLDNTDRSGRSVPLESHFVDFKLNQFWRWTDFMSYVQCLIVFTCGVGLVTYFFMSTSVYVETIGFLAVFTEAMLGAPQFYKNFQNKSTKGMSIKMVLFWLAGDLFKTAYFFLRAAPIQFWVCGLMQISIDFAILAQVGYYQKPATS